MKTKELIESRLARMRVVMATSKSARALNTERTYISHLRSFLWFCAYCPQVRNGSPEELARRMHSAELELAERNSYDYVIHSRTKEQDFRALLDYWAQARAKLA